MRRGEKRAAREDGRDPNTATLGPSNFRTYATEAIQAYERKGMFVDAMLWARIIRHYEEALTDALQAAAFPEGVARSARTPGAES